MKTKILVNVLFPAVIFYAAVISEGVLHRKNKKPSIFPRLSTAGRKDGNLKFSEGFSTRKTSGKQQIAASVLRPESVTNAPQSNDLGRIKGKRNGCQICHSCQPCVGGCMQQCECDCCHHECDEGCWCPIPGVEEEPKKKPEEPCCCPCCCPCCPTPCCHHPCCHHIHHHHHHCCPCCHCCNCCHCCHCCPCCCHCCHCKRSQGPLSPPFFRRPFYFFMVSPCPYFTGPYSGHGYSPLRNGPLGVF